jgi:hypothetical protein
MGGKRTLKIGDLMGTVVIPFMPMKTDEDYEALVELAKNPSTSSLKTHWSMSAPAK